MAAKLTIGESCQSLDGRIIEQLVDNVLVMLGSMHQVANSLSPTLERTYA